ncbi:MAG: hypothetical protein A2Y82_05540 [Candidatus Buchananbacteria bacterium RBG_13_36_9]|uniref:Uncharacterized protein n=1 Tax=Candidatus Buchananbacteria bacterium RBG_13_36_9 TaxID=1797530 RepID=A0A1G1XQJ9_9BACT|nr:MAG: hypothetical protein A2Y82_05540 [Candidatus Buchananbacteria bacterium RBG_13_36_9]
MNICEEYLRHGKITNEVLKDATIEELTALKSLVNEDITSIKNQLDEAKAKLIANGEYADANWHQKANAAKRIKGQLSQRIQEELSRKKQIRLAEERKQKDERRKQNEKDQVGYLIEAIHRVLTPKQAEKVLNMWRKIRP